jgi:hypothetical protein
MVLRLAKAGIDAEALDFFHSPKEGEVTGATSRLEKLGALNEAGQLTKVGRDMERMPVESHYARMMIEARKYGRNVQTQLAAALATQSAGGILRKGRNSANRWKSLMRADTADSDLLKELEVFIAAESMPASKKREYDITLKGFAGAKDAMRQLCRIEKLDRTALSMPTDTQRQQLIKCIVAGMVDNLYIQEESGYYRDAEGMQRLKGKHSLTAPETMMVGEPFNLEVPSRRGMMTLKLVENVTNVASIDLLKEVAPQLFREEFVGMASDEDGVIVEKWKSVFNDREIGVEVQKPSAPSEERRQKLIKLMSLQAYKVEGGDIYDSIYSAVERLRHKSGDDRIPRVDWQDIVGLLDVGLPLEAGSMQDAVSYLPPFELEDLVPREVQEKIEAASPDEYYGLQLEYSSGTPLVRNFYDEQILQLPKEAYRLPDGREIYQANTYRRLPLATIAAELREAKERKKRDREAAIREGEKMAADTLAAAYEEASHRARVEPVESSQDIALKSQISDKTKRLRSRLRYDGITGIPGDLSGAVNELRTQVDRAADAYPDIHKRFDRLVELEDEFKALDSRVAAWRSSTQRGKVTDDMLAKLQARFS